MTVCDALERSSAAKMLESALRLLRPGEHRPQVRKRGCGVDVQAIMQ